VQTIEPPAVGALEQSSLQRLARSKRNQTKAPIGLEIIVEGAFLKEVLVKPLLEEANEITRIMAKSRISASRRLRANRQLAIGNRK
jgi:hypothetical protein